MKHRKTKLLLVAALGVAVLTAGCCTTNPRADTVYQVSTIDALLEGAYDGEVRLAELNRGRMLGLGTVDHLDGELVVLDGKAWHVTVDGVARPVPREMTTPFACLVRYDPEREVSLAGVPSLDDLQARLDNSLTNVNVFYALRLDGRFDYLRTRSVPRQSPPYAPLAEVAKKQQEFEFHDVEGTLLAFRCPPYTKGINVPGYHWHFITADRTAGGHVLDCRWQAAQAVGVDPVHNFKLSLPVHEGFAELDLERDKSHELEQIER